MSVELGCDLAAGGPQFKFVFLPGLQWDRKRKCTQEDGMSKALSVMTEERDRVKAVVDGMAPRKAAVEKEMGLKPLLFD